MTAILSSPAWADHAGTGTVDSNNIVDFTIQGGSNGDIDASTITGTNMAADSIGNAHIRASGVCGSVNSDCNRDGSAAKTHIRAGSIGTADIADGGVEMGDLAQGVQDMIASGGAPAADSIGNAEMADDAVGSAEIINGGVMAADIGDDQVTAAKIAANAVQSAEIMDGGVMEADIGDNQVTAAKIADGAITADKLDANIELGVGEDAITGQREIADGAIEVVGSAGALSAQNPNNAFQARIMRGSIGFDDFAPEVNNAFRKIEGDIDRLDEGIAMSMALSGIQMPHRKEFGVSVSGGFYQNKQAAAIGIGFRPTDDLLLSAGAAYGFDSEEVGGRVSITFGF